MARPKKKESEAPKSRGRSTQESTGAPETPAAIAQVWHEEISAMIDRRYESVLAVITDLAERVCVRLGQPNDPELREFLVMAMDTDAELREELEKLVAPKSK